MKSKFVLPNNPILTKKAQKIPQNKLNSSETREIIQTMLKVAYGERQKKKKSIMVGLAAPQIGIPKRIILADIKADGKGLPAGRQVKVGDLHIYINPEITWRSKEQIEWYEGCFSTSRVCGIVSRPVSVKIRAYIPGFLPSQPQGFESRIEKHTGYVARIFQHEIDHLNGIRFPDLITDPNKLHWVNKSEFHLYRNKQAWRNWPRKCSFEKWKSIHKPLA